MSLTWIERHNRTEWREWYCLIHCREANLVGLRRMLTRSFFHVCDPSDRDLRGFTSLFRGLRYVMNHLVCLPRSRGWSSTCQMSAPLNAGEVQRAGADH
jgi:hypothetical protein